MGQPGNQRIKKIHELIKNEDTTIQNFGDTEKAVLRGKYIAYIAIQASLKKLEKNSNTQANLPPERTGERTACETYTKQKKRDNKDLSRTQ